MKNENKPQWVKTRVEDGIATVRLEREKVNALVPEVIEQLTSAVNTIASEARAIVLTGTGPFFSFGFDVPHMIRWSRAEFGAFVSGFCELYRNLFLFPKPVIAAINGHCIAGGCMLALAADVRVMSTGRPKISLNEITFGASVFAGAVEMLRFHVDGRNASRILYTGEMLDAGQAASIGLVDRGEQPDDVMGVSRQVADQLSSNLDAFSSIKRLLRRGVGERMVALEAESIEQFLDIWYSTSTQHQLAGVTIR